MNREIKFRAWDGKRMHEWDNEFFSDTSEVTHFSGLFSDIKMNLMQFTGLKDKNGVEIYESDVLAFEQEKNFKKVFIHHFEIKWDNDRAAWTQFSPRELIVVVGNIYQNPELLTSNITQS